jgi:hypothetical protein
LIYHSSSGGYKISKPLFLKIGEKGAEFLSSIDEEVGVIAVAGKYRTGKSYLLNKIILQNKEGEGFGVGPTVNPCTKGLWVWSKPIVSQWQGNEIKVLVIGRLMN